MLIYIVGMFLLGCAGGATYAISMGTVAKTFPERIRARVMALLATMWILPGLVGPPLGAFIASTIGWRWAFVVPIPMLVLAASLVLPALGEVVPAEEADRLPIRWSVQLAIGLAALLGGLTLTNLWSVPLAVVGLATGLPALLHIVPEGTLRARPGLPGAAVAMFLLSGAFFTVDSFIPLMLTELHDFTLMEAGIVITVATVTWSAGSWWQSRNAGNIDPGVLVTIGTALVLAGILGVATGLIAGAPVLLVYIGWTVAGGGMGIAFPTIPLSVMSAAEEGKEAGQLSSTLLMDTLGATIGSGLGGASIAFATAARGNAGLRTGIAGAYALGLAGIILLLFIARRLPRGTGQPVD
jgi:MFS family permease